MLLEQNISATFKYKTFFFALKNKQTIVSLEITQLEYFSTVSIVDSVTNWLLIPDPWKEKRYQYVNLKNFHLSRPLNVCGKSGALSKIRWIFHVYSRNWFRTRRMTVLIEYVDYGNGLHLKDGKQRKNYSRMIAF